MEPHILLHVIQEIVPVEARGTLYSREYDLGPELVKYHETFRQSLVEGLGGPHFIQDRGCEFLNLVESHKSPDPCVDVVPAILGRKAAGLAAGEVRACRIYSSQSVQLMTKEKCFMIELM